MNTDGASSEAHEEAAVDGVVPVRIVPGELTRLGLVPPDGDEPVPGSDDHDEPVHGPDDDAETTGRQRALGRPVTSGRAGDRRASRRPPARAPRGAHLAEDPPDGHVSPPALDRARRLMHVTMQLAGHRMIDPRPDRDET